MKKKNQFKYIVNFLIIFIVLGIVLYFSLKDHYEEILSAIMNMNHWYTVLAILSLCLYRICISISHWLIIKSNQEEVSILRCIQINFIILFFHGVTPFAGGGQPMEIYYLHRENIPITKATNITLQNFIVYQIALVLVGFIALIYNYYFNLFPSNHLIKKLVILGFFINLLILVISFILSFGKKIQHFISSKGIHLLAKIHFIKNEEEVQTSFSNYLDSFHENALQLRSHKRFVLGMILISMIGLCILYSMPYIVAKGMHISISLMDAMVATAYVMIIGSFVPIPGGTGGIEYGFIFFYSYLLRGSIVNAIMLVWRFISYYLGIIFGAIALLLYRKGEKA